MIEQVRFSSGVKFFEADFCKRWNLNLYSDIDAPCLFAGVYFPEDIRAINDHKGFKVVWNWGGIGDFFNNLDPVNVVVMMSPFINHDSISDKYKKKKANIQIKDFSMFTPNKLGDKVYCYLGNPNVQDQYGYEVVEKLKKEIEFEVIYGYLGHSINFIKEQYYDNCFVNIKTKVIGGMTTATELAYMGRMTISNTKAPFCIDYKDNILDIIREESKKIGTIQPSMIGDFFDTGEEWKQLKFWL